MSKFLCQHGFFFALLSKPVVKRLLENKTCSFIHKNLRITSKSVKIKLLFPSIYINNFQISFLLSELSFLLKKLLHIPVFKFLCLRPESGKYSASLHLENLSRLSHWLNSFVSMIPLSSKELSRTGEFRMVIEAKFPRI